MRTALVLVDLQPDFCPGGALAVVDGDATIAVANAAMREPGIDVVVATQDLHPPDHGSLASQHPGRAPYELIDLHGLPQVLWPDHCVRDTPGAALHPALDQARIAAVFPKGTDRAVDSYSGFWDNGRRRATGLAAWLRGQGVTRLVVLGLATDYCVKHTVLDGLAEGFAVELRLAGCRAVELRPGDGAAAIAAMVAAGAIAR